MRLIGQEVDALAEHQLNEFAGERLLTGLSLKCRSRPRAVSHQSIFGTCFQLVSSPASHCLRNQIDA